ncbi:MAG: tetratricopeptide repeat protein [Anaerolineales bacterium]|nr:tetratricopeptide repeat protein [Anaerolineales bacterium]
MTSIPISKTKIIPPRRREELLERKRLLDMLFEAMEKKLVLVSAPAGYGKTSLLIDLVLNSEYKCCWLSLDELDREPQRFAAYLTASIAQQFPGFGVQSNAVLEGMTSFEAGMERLTVSLVNEAFESIKEHFILILDDFHLLQDVTLIAEFLNRFIQLVDDNCHIVISSRMLTALTDLSLMVAREQVGGLDFSDLAFRMEEIQALALKNNRMHLTDEEAEKLIAETEGWITGLQFVGTNIPRFNTGVGLFDYLGQQVVDRQKPAIQEFLLRSSLIEEFDSALCEAVLASFYSERQDWDGFIRAVIQNNLFALPVGADGRSLRYHHLFRDYLQNRFKREKPDEVRPLLINLGAAYERMGEWDKAHHATLQLQDVDLLAAMIERACLSISIRPLSVTEAWLGDLPPSILGSRPGIISIRGVIAYTKGEFDLGLELLARAEAIFRESADMPNLTLTLVRRAMNHRFLGDYEASLRDAEEAAQISEGRDGLQMLYAEAMRIKGLVLFRLGKARQAATFLEQALSSYTTLKDFIGIPLLLTETGMVYESLGRYSDAEMSYEKALPIWKQQGNLTGQANLLNNMGYVCHLQGQYEKAAYTYEEGLLCARRSAHSRMEALISIGLGDLYTELQDAPIAAQNYQRAADLIADGMQERFLLFSLQLGRINLALLQRDFSFARASLDDMKAMVDAGRSDYEHGYYHLTNGKWMMFAEDISGAISEFSQAESFLENGREVDCAVARIWLAAAYHQNGETDHAAETIRVVVQNQGRVLHAVIVAFHQARSWLEGLQKNRETGRLVRDWFARVEKLNRELPSVRRELHRQARVIEMPAPHLSIQALGHARVSMGGRLLNNSDWQALSARDLFLFFLTRTKPMTKEQVAEILWPELDEPARIRQRFKNDIYRLRRALGQEDIIQFQNDAYFFNRNLDYEYDVEAFESHLSKAGASKSITEQMEAYERAAALVQGPFLDDLYHDWIMADRERLNRLYLDALLSLGNLYLKSARFQEGLTLCQRAVEYDPSFEAIYRLWMQIYHKLNDPGGIRRVYNACVEAMERYFSMPPSPETESLYRKLSS